MTDKSSQIFSKIQFLIKEKQFDHALQLMQVYDEDLKKNYLYFLSRFNQPKYWFNKRVN